MTLRLVLVSLVAALGFTVPGAPVIERWVASTQNWMNARFADWDTRNPDIADYVIVSNYFDVEQFAPRPAKPSCPVTAPVPSDLTGPPLALSAAYSNKPALPQNTGSGVIRPVSFARKSSAFEPIPVVTDLGVYVACDLNNKNQAIGLVPAKTVAKPAAPVRPQPMAALKKLYRDVRPELVEFARTLVSTLPRIVFPCPSTRSAAPVAVAKRTPKPTVAVTPKPAVAATPKPTVVATTKPTIVATLKPTIASAPRPSSMIPGRSAAVVSRTFGPMETSANLYFAGELTPPARIAKPAAPIEVAKSASRRVTAIPKQPVATETRSTAEDLDIEVAGELLPLDDGFGAPSAGRIPFVASMKRRFEPLEVSPDYWVGTAFELNFRNDGLTLQSNTTASGGRLAMPDQHASADLGRAVKLTRDAVYAWVHVLTGPALVTVSHGH